MTFTELWLWAVNDFLDDELWDRQSKVTDVFRRSQRPPRNSVVLGLDLDFTIRAVGIVGPAQAVATGKDRVAISPLLYPEPISMQAVIARIPGTLRRRFDDKVAWPGPLSPSRLSPQLATVVLQTLRGLSPIVDEWLAGLELVARPISGRRGLRMREERDAVALALDISQLRVPSAAAVFPRRSPQGAVAFAQAMGAVVAEDNEDDLIAEDLRRFDPHGKLVLQGAATARFVDGDFALTILNVNRKPLEHVLGVDLVYWDETRNVFTLVQYKRLTCRPSAQDTESLGEWTYKRKSELLDQLALMDIGRHRTVHADDWRLSRSPFWFKFARTDAFHSADPLVLRGMYVSAEYLRLAIADGSLQSGPRSGFEINHHNTSYITRRPFVELLRRGLLGTTNAGSKRVWAIINELSQKREVVVAIKSPRNQENIFPQEHQDDSVFDFDPF